MAVDRDDVRVEQTRNALRRLAKSVAIITSRDASGRHAMAATAVSGLSLTPPSMLVCIDHAASLGPVLSGGAPFAINLLDPSHVTLVRHCSGGAKGEARFSQGQWTDGPLDLPYLADAQAVFFCDHANAAKFGTHHIIIGEVMHVEIHGEVRPLIYVDGAFTETGIAIG